MAVSSDSGMLKKLTACARRHPGPKADRVASLFVAAFAALAFFSTAAQAGCSTSGTTVTCSGNLISAGVNGLTYSSDDGVDTLIVEDMDDGYLIDGTDVVISLTGTGADGSDDGDDGDTSDDLTITYDTGDDGWFGYKVVDYGIEVFRSPFGLSGFSSKY